MRTEGAQRCTPFSFAAFCISFLRNDAPRLPPANNVGHCHAEKVNAMKYDYKDYNPRYGSNPRRRKRNRERIKAMGLPCHICGKPIRYDEPTDAKHPLSFVVDEIIPVSRWREFGYDSPEAVANDFSNLAPAHYACNAMKGNKVAGEGRMRVVRQINQSDGNW